MKKKTIALVVAMAMIMQIVAPTAWGISEELEAMEDKIAENESVQNEITTKKVNQEENEQVKNVQEIIKSEVGTADNQTEIVFADQNLKNELLQYHDADQDGKITVYDMENLINFNYYNWENPIDLQGLETAINLEEVVITAQDITHPEVLQSATNLHSLALNKANGECLGDISFIQNYTNLEKLSLTRANLKNIVIPNKVNDLGIYNCQIEVLSQLLEPLTNLNALKMSGTEEKNLDFSAIVNKKDTLQTLIMEDMELVDISFVAEMKNLKCLEFRWNKIENIEPITHLTQLENLNLMSNALQDIAGIEKLVNLKELYIAGNAIKDVSMLENMNCILEDSQNENQYQVIELETVTVNLGEEKEIALPSIVQSIYNPSSKFYIRNLNAEIYNNWQENVQIRINEDGTKLYLTCPDELVSDQSLEIWFEGEGRLNGTNLHIPYQVKAKGDNRQEVVFADEEFKNYLLENYDDDQDGKITAYDMAQITYLYFFKSEGTFDLQGLEYAVNLQNFETYSQVTNEGVLGNLTKLEVLRIHLNYDYQRDEMGNVIYNENGNCTYIFEGNASFLENLTNLKNLEISYADLKNVQLPTSLEMLFIDGSEIGSIDHIMQNLGKLKELTLRSSANYEIVDFSGLSKYQSLTNLSIIDYGVEDIQFVSTLNNLKYLSLMENEIQDITPIQNLSNLHYLYLGANQIENINAIKNMSFAEDIEIELSCNQISDLSALEGKTNYYIAEQRIEQNVGNVYLGEEIEIELPLSFRQVMADAESPFYEENVQSDLEMYNENMANVNYRLSEDKTKIILQYMKLPTYSKNGELVLRIQNSKLAGSSFTIQFAPKARGDNTVEVAIPDMNLKNYLLENYDDDQDGKITQYDMAQIANLQINYQAGVENLQGLEEAKNLRMLSIDGYVESIMPIIGLTNLEYLRVNCKNTQELNELANLTSLRTLNVYASELTDISFVRNLQNLESFGFGYAVEDISPLEGLTNLHYLYMGSNHIKDINVLKTLPNLEHVSLNYNNIEDGTILETLETSEYEGIYAQNIEKDLGTILKGETIEIDLPDILKRVLCQEANSKFYKPEAIIELEDYSGDMQEKIEVSLNSQKDKLVITPKMLTESYMDYESFNIKIKNAGSFENTNLNYKYKTAADGDKEKIIEILDESVKKAVLEEVDEDGNDSVSEYEIHQLTRLYLYGLNIKNLEGLQYAENLNELNLNEIEAIPQGLEKLDMLKKIGVYQYEGKTITIEQIAQFTNLQELQLCGNIDKTSISYVLRSLTNLKKLSVYNIKDMPLEVNTLAQLEELILNDCELKEIPNLTGMEKIRLLDVSRNQIEDITPVKNLPNLETLVIGNNQVKDIQVIRECPKLQNMEIYNNYISDISAYLEIMGNIWSIGTQNITKTIQEPITLGESGYSLELPQIAQYLMQEKGYILNGKGDIVFSVSEDKKNVIMQKGTVGPKIVIEIVEDSEYPYNKIVLTIDATIVDETPITNEATFEDAEFKKAILMQVDINKDGKISEKEMQDLEHLYVERNPKIISIKGIEKAINLRGIAIISCRVKDISPITELEKLETFDFVNNEITDVTCLENAKFANSIYDEGTSLAGNYIDFTEGNANYQAYYKIMHAWLEEGNKKISVSFDRDIHSQNYGTLEGRFREVSMEPALKNKLIEQGIDIDKDGILTQYEMQCIEDYLHGPNGDGITFNLENAGITNISGLEYCSIISRLDLSGNQITDIAPLTKCGGLNSLDISNNKITSLDGIEKCHNLKYIYASNNQIKDITPIGKLHFMTVNLLDYAYEWGMRWVNVNLANNQIEDITPVKDFLNIGELDLSGNQIKDISPLKEYRFEFGVVDGVLAWSLTINLNENCIDMENAGNKEAKTVFDEKKAILLLNNQKELPTAIKGDVNGDGKVSLYDAFKILEVAILGGNISAEETYVMDYNNDGNVSLYDAFKFLEIAILG